MTNRKRHLYQVALVVLSSFGLLSVAAAQSVTRIPYLQSATPSSVVVKWRTDVATDSVVRYGATPTTLTLSESDPSATTEHEVQLTGLSADTKYYYSVGTSSATLAGGESDHFVVTPPVAGTAKPTRVWVIGDSGTANASAMAVRDAFLNFTGPQDPDLWMMLGDNAYPDGTDSEYQAAVFDIYPQLLTKSVLWSTLGNHDGHTADSASESGPYYDIFTLPRNGEAGGVPSGTEAYYSFDYGNIHFICLESYETDRSSSGAMMTWLELDLQANDKEWIIAFWHHPPYTKGSHDSDNEGQLIDMRENAVPVLEQYGVDLVLTGHSHSYERSYLVDGHYGSSGTFSEAMKVDPGDGSETGDGAYQKPETVATPHAGAVYAVAGSSGKISGGALNHPVMVVSMSVLGSMVLDVNGNRLDAKFLDSNGNIQDDFVIMKGPDTTPPQISSVLAQGAPTQVSVMFSEGVEQTSAEATANYAIDNGVTVSAANLGADNRTVTLTTTPLSQGVSYTLTVNNVVDLASNPIATDSQAQFQYFNIVDVSFQDGVSPTTSYAGTTDTYLSQNAPTSNFGSSTTLLLDGDDPGGSGNDLASVLRWDISSIPAGSIVDAAQVTLDVFDPTSGAYEIYELTRNWVEGDATWNVYSAGSGWQTPGAQGALDRGALVLGTVAAASTGLYNVSLNADGLTVVQSWIDNPATNNGIIIADSSTTNGVDIRSSEYGTATSRPKLTISYNPASVDIEAPTAPSNLSPSSKTDTEVSLQWDAATDNIGVTDYTIYRDAVAVGTTSGLTYTDTGLTANTSYDFHVTASDAAANESGASNVLTVVTDALPPGGSSNVSFQDGVSPTPAYAGTRDTYISQNSPTANFGTSAEFLLDGDDPSGSGNDLSTLLKWDIAQIPAGSIVESAQIDIEVFNRSSGIYELFEVKQDWAESQASWNDHSSGNSWQTGGAQGANDRGTTVLGSIAATVTGPHSVVLNAAGVALLQAWVDDPAANYGIIAAGSGVTDGLDARSREFGTATQRPRLTVTYSASSGDTESPTVPTNLQETARTTTTASLSWTASTDNVGVTEYGVYRGGVEIGTTGGTSFTDIGLTPNTSYSYHATARDAAGNESGSSGVVVILTDPATNTSPAVSITSPANGSVVTEGTSISFAGTASDVEEGDLTASLSWTSNIDGAIGTGGSFSTALSLGSHVVTAVVTDTGGALGSDVVTVIVDLVGLTPQFDGAMAWPLCGRIDEAPPVGWSDADGCPTVRWGDATFSDLPIHSPFGPRRLASEGARYDFHRGIDLATPTGTPIFAVTDGIVRISGDHPSYSDPLVQLRHFRPGETSCNAGGCYHSNYLHLSQTVVAEDDVVSKGDLLGYTGASASGFEHLHFEIRDAPASDPFSIWQRDTIDSLGVLPYEEPSGAAIIFNSVDTSSPSEPIVSLTVQTAHVDVQRVELTLSDSVGTVLPQPGNTPDARGYNVNPSWFGMNEWNRQYTHKDSTNVPWESFGAGGVNECPYHPDHPGSYDAHVHMDQQSPGDFQVGLFNGVELSRPPISGGIYTLHLTFHELVGAADCYTAEVFFSAGGSTTEQWGVCPGSGNVAPVVSMTSPANGSSVTEGTSISFAGTANDTEDGDLTASLAWSSDIDGTIGAGAGFSAVLSVGTHNITAAVTDSGGQLGSDVISITVATNVAPVVSITSPANGSSVTEGTNISFAGTANDAEDGDLTASLAWSSNIDGAIGTGTGFSAVLSVGTHSITASVTDGGGLPGSDVISVTVAANTPPAVSITSPADGSSFAEGNSVAFSGAAVDAESGDLTAGLAWVSDLDGAIGSGGSFSTALSVGTHVVTASVTDSGGLQGFAAISVAIDATPPAGLTMEQVVVSNVTNTAWTTVPLANTYGEMVVVCSPNYDSASAPLVPRVTNAAGSSFDLRVDRADASTAAVAGVSVHCVAVEEGVYSQTDHGVKMEAVKYASTVTDGKGSWNGEARAYANAYSAPVVVGQVMTYNDVRHSVFWTRGSSSKAPPSSSALRVGKHVGEDSNTNRADETIGYIVVEAGNGVIDGVSFEAGLGADSVRGVGNSPPYSYTLSGSLSTVSAGIVSQAGMDSGEGSWAVLYGANPATPGNLSLAADEDQLKDTERKHTTEQVGYLVFE